MITAADTGFTFEADYRQRTGRHFYTHIRARGQLRPLNEKTHVSAIIESDPLRDFQPYVLAGTILMGSVVLATLFGVAMAVIQADTAPLSSFVVAGSIVVLLCCGFYWQYSRLVHQMKDVLCKALQ